MSAKSLKAVAISLLALAIAGLVAALWFSNQRVSIQGPSALAVLDDQTVWLSVDDALWHLDAQGQRIAIADAQSLAEGGVGGLIGNLVVHPNGQLVASVRDDPTLYFLDPASGNVVSRLLPQWPADLAQHGARAITYAFAADGRVAIATGGGHTVALFDAQGQFLARTAPNTYEFTNGLWWTADSLWTTNTNGAALLELDPHNLATKSHVKLARSLGHGWALGMAVASAGQPVPNTSTRPFATLVRFANGMVEGHVTDVLPDGAQITYPTTAIQEPRDIKWHGAELLLVDGASYAIKRYSDNREPLTDFGSPDVQSQLAGLLAKRASLQKQYGVGLTAAIVLFLLGFAAAIVSQRLEKQTGLATQPPAPVRANVPGPQTAKFQTLASLIVPGLGQWMQRRKAAALGFFLAWALILVFSVIPVVWTLWGPRASVSWLTSLSTAWLYAVVCILAAADSWRVQPRRG